MHDHDDDTMDTTADEPTGDEGTLADLLADDDEPTAEPTAEPTGDEPTGDKPEDEDTVADALRRLLPEPDAPCPDDLTREELWAAVKELRRENARRRGQARTAKAAAAVGTTPEGMTTARAEAMAEAGLVVEYGTLRAAAAERGVRGANLDAVVTLAGARIARDGLDPAAADYLTNIGAAAAAAVDEVMDELPTLATPAEPVPPISQGVRGSGHTAPPSADAWLRGVLTAQRRT